MQFKNQNFSAFDDKDKPSIDIINDCVRCGFCLPSCPTYVETGNELDSPRGRIHLMKNAVEGKIPLDSSLVKHLDLCLGCLACETSCPSGVKYSSLIESSRSQIERRYKRNSIEKIIREIIFYILPYPNRLKLLLPLLLIYHHFGIKFLLYKTGFIEKLPEKIKGIIKIIPDLNISKTLTSTPTSVKSRGKTKFRIALLKGCVQSVFFPSVNQATIRVLSKSGCDVFIPRNQGCCGALSLHSGRLEEARTFARNTIDNFLTDNFDYIIVNSAGCGSSIKEYSDLLKDDEEYLEKAKQVIYKTKDIMEFLYEIGINENLKQINKKVTYQDACHLIHGQKIKSQPRDLIQQIPGIEFIELPESDTCCGSAGIYNLVQTDMSQRILDNKIANIIKIKPDLVAAGNPGCLMQIQSGLRNEKIDIGTCHPIELLDEAIV